MGFLSYAHFDDEHNLGWITAFCQTLGNEVRAQTGKPFQIFQDRRDIKWGESWRERIKAGLDASTFFFPVITPSFLQSVECKRELRDFLEHERKRKRADLVLPIYYIRCKEFDQKRCSGRIGTLVRALQKHQLKDLTDLRFEDVEENRVRKFVAKMAEEVCSAIIR